MNSNLKVFIKVVECESFSLAAKKMQVATSSVTRAIQQLENELGVKLLNRNTRRLFLTESGELFYKKAKKLTEDYDLAVSSVRPSEVEPEGSLKISVFESFGRLHICPLIPKFLTLYPKVIIDISLENKVVDLYKDEVDLAIRFGVPKDSNLMMRKITVGKTILCASKKYIKTHNMISHPKQLDSHNCLLLNKSSKVTYWYFKKRNRHIKTLVKGNLTSQAGTPLIEAAKQGVGIVLLSLWFVQPELEADRLVHILPDWSASLSENNTDSLYAVFLQDNYMRPVLRKFIDFMMAEFEAF